MRAETFEDLCSVVVKQREEITALRQERDTAKDEARATRENAVRRAEADRVRIECLTEERNQLRAKLEAVTVAVHTAPAVPKLDMLGKTVHHSSGRVGVVTCVSTETVDGAHWTLYMVKRTDGATGSQIWHASNCTIIEAKTEQQPAKEPEPRKHPVKVGEWVRRTVPAWLPGAYTVGDVAQVTEIDEDGTSYRVRLSDHTTHAWRINNCEPCDPPEGAERC